MHLRLGLGRKPWQRFSWDYGKEADWMNRIYCWQKSPRLRVPKVLYLSGNYRTHGAHIIKSQLENSKGDFLHAESFFILKQCTFAFMLQNSLTLHLLSKMPSTLILTRRNNSQLFFQGSESCSEKRRNLPKDPEKPAQSKNRTQVLNSPLQAEILFLTLGRKGQLTVPKPEVCIYNNL